MSVAFLKERRSLGTPDDDGLQLLGAHHRAQTMSRRVVVVVDEHGSANEVLARGADATDARVLMTRLPYAASSSVWRTPLPQT